MRGLVRPLQGILLALALSGIAGCVHMTAPGYQPGVANTETLQRNPGTKLAVDGFSAGPEAHDAGLSVRGSPLTAGGDGRFSGYLHDAAVKELETARRFDAAAPLHLSGQLLRNDLHADIGTGHAVMAARFVVARGGATVYDKPVQVQHQWESSFVGAIAIPAAVDNYLATVQKLLGALFADPDFVRATSDPSQAASR